MAETTASQATDWNAIAATVIANFEQTGTWDWNGAAEAPVPAAATGDTVTGASGGDTQLGSGADRLVLKISQDAYDGDAQYTIAIDGQQIGDVLTAHSLHGQGSDTVTLHGDWGNAQHRVTVTFLNDAWGGSWDADRNLHVDSVSYNGTNTQQAADLNSQGSHDFAIGQAAVQAPDAPANDASTGSAPVPVTTPVEAAPAAGSPSGFHQVWHESFDHGLGMFDRAYGHVDTGTPGQVTLTAYASENYQVASGVMVAPTGADQGFGYGLYEFTLSASTGTAPGVFACLWPASDKWPGPELDLVEVYAGGGAYSTLHWDDNGGNGQASHWLDGVDVTRTHTYGMDWEDGRITLYVDGEEKWTTTENVPKDFAHGGENEVPGVGMQAGWAAAYQHGDNSVTFYDASYSVIG
ncbi:family 16 glycosylhydrolase [Belnapia sp. T6]|uniref:Family 16 glycosylhydrolase n=1 Tax=Belnapia mucosa TaxID=2804532 RepID=A0ABS1V207_9PROT|nr:carbohydrate-binding domain-containing protein [Belnapia mucosa]MBL6454699.1 family 16 glycosylhydrolase [Belnapia mucosa]